MGSVDRQQIDDEHEWLVRSDHAARATGAVGHCRGDREPAPAPDSHALHALVPARDHLSLAELELERLAAVPRGVELLAGREGGADVVHRHLRARHGRLAVADDDVVNDELEGDITLGLFDAGSLQWQGVAPMLVRSATVVDCWLTPTA